MGERVDGSVDAVETPIGLMPCEGDLLLEGLDISPSDYAELMKVDKILFAKSLDDVSEYFASFGPKISPRLTQELDSLRSRLK